MIISLIKLAIGWLYQHATAKVYSSPVPIGRHLGGRDNAAWPDEYIILDVRAANRILVLGYFQLT